MKIGMVGPKVWLDESMKRISHDFPDILFIPFPYHLPIELPDILEGEQHRCDFFLFMGETARRWAARQITPAVPWFGIPRSTAAFLRILTQASYHGCPPRFITDYQDPDYFRHALDEAGITPEDSYVSIISYGTFNADRYMSQNAELMIKEFHKGKAAFCATIFSETYDILQKNHIPSYYFIPCFEDTRHRVQEIVTSSRLQASRQNRIAIMSVHIDSEGEDISGKNDLLSKTMAKLETARHIYDFAYRLQSSCVPLGMDDFMIFTMKDSLEAATNHFTQVDLLRTASNTADLTLSIGIGCGETVLNAESRARQAMKDAIANHGNCAYFIGDREGCIGPIRWGSAAPVQESPDFLIAVAKETGISFHYLQSMRRLCLKEQTRLFTPSQLADAAGIRKRTMNRILLKLMDHGYCREKGKTFPKQRGRPSRIVELLLDEDPHVEEA